MSMKSCTFGDAIFFSDKPVNGNFRFKQIKALRSTYDYSQFILYKIHHFIKTKFLLIVQWDGYVLNSSAWTDKYFDYDYVGAVWPSYAERKVGNGGFSLRSLRLLQATASLPQLSSMVAEDKAICRIWADTLETDHGIRFSTEALANQFSYEQNFLKAPTFGFHGMFNMWRHTDDDEFCKVISSVNMNSFGQNYFLACMLNCFFENRSMSLNALYQRLRAGRSVEEIRNMVGLFCGDHTIANALVRMAEGALAVPAIECMR